MATKMKLSLVAVHPAGPKPGDLCVWNMTDPPHRMDRYSVATLAEAKGLIRRLVAEQLKDDSVGCNAFGLEAYRTAKDDPLDLRKTGEWEEWEDGMGEDVIAVIDAEDDQATQPDASR